MNYFKLFFSFFVLLAIFSVTPINAQVVINEIVSSNQTGIADEDNDNPDWIELYNTSNSRINLQGWVLKDRENKTDPWVFPEVYIEPHSWLLVYASGKDRKNIPFNYRTVIDWGDEWQYYVPDNEYPPDTWRETSYTANNWLVGPSGFGYGDNDDNTEIQSLYSIYIRKQFAIENIDALTELVLHVDYDDAFIAFINGQVVAMDNLSLVSSDNFNDVNVGGNHEAQMYQSGNPTLFSINPQGIPLFEGENILALQGYNTSQGSSDFSLIPFLTLGSGAYPVTEVSEHLNLTSGGGLHTNFKIDAQGESLWLLNNNGDVSDTVDIVTLLPDVSYGRFTDGSSEWKYFMNPTPGTQNTNPNDEIISDTIFFSQPAGFYAAPLAVELSAKSPQAIIRYTTNGSWPTVDSPVYSEPIQINSSSVIRAAAFRNGVRDRDVFSASYFRNSGHSLPVISIAGNPDDFFDYYEGILVEGPNAEPQDPHYGANYWMDWEKPINIEFFNKNKQPMFSQMAGIKIFGGYSRMNPQKSMAVFARNQYRKNRFPNHIFTDRAYPELKSFMLRNSGNDWQYTMLRDAYVSELVKNLNVDRLAYQPSVIYLNGEYWGILNAREKPGEYYMATNHNVDPDVVNRLEMRNTVIEGNGQRYTQLRNYLSNNTLNTDEKYHYVQNEMDVDCFTDYQLIEIFINNRDWPDNNVKYWNTESLYSKWRWILYDTDFGLGIYGNDEYTENGIEFATEQYNNSWPNSAESTLLLRKLLTNEQFRFNFINRMADLINTTFQPANMNSVLDSVRALIDPEIEMHQQKWGRSYADWENKFPVIETFNTHRQNYVLQHFSDYFDLGKICNVQLSVSAPLAGRIKVHSIIPSEYPFTGKYFCNVPITFEAMAMPGYRFVKWEGDSQSDRRKITLTLTNNTALRAVFEYDQTIDRNIVINEVNYISPPDNNAGDWIELYNAGTQIVDLSNWRLIDSQEKNIFMIKAGTKMNPGDYLVLCSDIVRFKTQYSNLLNVQGSFAYGFTSQGDQVRLYDSNLQLIDQVNFRSANPWPTEPLSSHSTIELIDAKNDNSVPENWAASVAGGTPGRKNSVSNNLSDNSEIADAAFDVKCFPVCFADFTTLQIYTPQKTNCTIQIIDLMGNVRQTHTYSLDTQGKYSFDLFTLPQNYAPGMYLIKTHTLFGCKTVKVIKK